MSRGILPQSDSDWGEFLLTFQLGLNFVVSYNLATNFFSSDSFRGERGFRGPCPGALTILPLWWGSVSLTQGTTAPKDILH